MPDDTVIGLLRYELIAGKKRLVEWSKHSNTHSAVPFLVLVNNRLYFTGENVHQASFIIEARNLKQIVKDNQFVFNWIDCGDNANSNENATTNLYRGKWPGSPQGLIKVYPVTDLDRLLIHHMPNKYANDGFTDFEELRERVRLVC